MADSNEPCNCDQALRLTEELKKSRRLCLECMNLAFINAMPNYSEYTPGHGMELRCTKSRWDLDTYKDDRVKMQNYLETARTCADFESMDE